MKKSLSFLRKLSKNNNRDWMIAHKEEYLECKQEFEFFVQELIVRVTAWDKRMPFLEPKECTFRLNRDVRFTDDKRPYKENFGAFICYGGKKSNLPGYYFHLSPKEIFVAGGVWMPEPDQLLKLRRYLSENGEEFENILNNKTFKKAFGGLNTESKLKRPPKGFSAGHPYEELLKFKSFTVSKNLTQADALKKGFGKVVDKNFKLMHDMNDFLYKVLKGQ